MAEGRKEEYKFDKSEKIKSNEDDNKNGQKGNGTKIGTGRTGFFPKKKIMHDSTKTHDNVKRETKKYFGSGRFDHTRKNLKDFRSHSEGRKNKEVVPLGKDSKSYLLQDNQNDINQIHLLELEKMDPENIIVFFSKNNTAFENLLTNTSNFNNVVLFLRVIGKLCTSSFNEYKSKIIKEITSKEFLQQLQIHIFSLAVQDEREKRNNMFFWRDQTRFWNDLLTLYNTIFQIIPQTACEKLPKIITASTVSIKNINKDNITVMQLDEIVKELELLNETMNSQMQTEIPKKRNDLPDPKDSFRNINIYPSLKEITTRGYPFIRRIIKDGAYNSVEQYLDIHFRLLREDFVSSLRNGICTYLENQTESRRTKQFDIRVYENVKFIRPHIVHDRVGILISYTSNLRKNINSENKHFMYGSLVCFTRDNFQSIIYGTVVDSDIELLKLGYIVVDVQDAIIYDENYIMVETTVFFEPYHQVLKALQNMREENFPMKNYIVDVDRKIEHPKYLNNLSTISLSIRDILNLNRCRINLTVRSILRFPVLGPGVQETREPITATGLNRSFRILSLNSWPPAEYFKLNSSQYRAFQTALTSEFSVIQGPPGTGKTYTSLKIVEFLLKHKQALRYTGPILVICLTNHALDQFLEGILPFSDEILRVGNQSKNVKMEYLNLKHYRRKIEMSDRNSYYKVLLEQEKQNVSQCVQKLECLQNLLEDITMQKGILNFKLFKIIDDKLENSWFDIVRPHHIVDWLMDGMTTDNITEEIQEFKNEEPEDIIEHELYSRVERLDRESRIIDDEYNYNSRIHFINNCILTRSEIRSDIAELNNRLLQLRLENKNFVSIKKCEKELQKLRNKQKYLNWRLNQKGVNDKLTENINYHNPFNLHPNERWNLYRHWVYLLRMQAYQDIANIDEEYRAAKRRYLEVQQIVDVYIMQKKSVIGMTTTAAAKHQPVLQTLKCQIVIVEEAAEVLESHVVAALTNYCQQLILIGDHLQLRPSASQYYLAKHYNLEISLFERMVNNGIHCQQLEVQHRMRPEFSKLITPAIYSNLKDDASVFNYPSVSGVTKNLFFITHNEFEEHIANSTSHRNIYEVEYLLKFASYLIKQEYSPEDITILTTYTGQMFAFWRERINFPELKDIRITVVDNFQGEENKIILLSLVRSNEMENIGFLKTENRVCVALSRAKLGFFMIGNMDNLEKSSKIWPKIKEVLVKQNSIGPVLALKCQVHEDETKIESHIDFDKVSEGGCILNCEKQLKCGHICALKCHPYDREHILYRCKEACTKILCERDHICPLLCSDLCRPCYVPVEKVLPCGHTHFIPCSTEPCDYNCPTKIEATLPCEHKATIKCYVKPEDARCPHPCVAIIKCGHKCNRNCHIKNDPNHEEYCCPEPCEKFKKDCSTQTHKCPKRCSDSCDPCTEQIKKKHTNCTHKAKVECNINIDKLECKEKCRKMLPCGHHCPNRCFMPCGNCKVWVDKTIEACGHTMKIRCGIQPEKKLCNKKCPLLLKCGHPCKENCSEHCSCRQGCFVMPLPPPYFNQNEDTCVSSVAFLFK